MISSSKIMIQVTLLMLGACTVSAMDHCDWEPTSEKGKNGMPHQSDLEYSGVDNRDVLVRANYVNDDDCTGILDAGKLEMTWKTGHLAGEMMIRSQNDEMTAIIDVLHGMRDRAWRVTPVGLKIHRSIKDNELLLQVIMKKKDPETHSIREMHREEFDNLVRERHSLIMYKFVQVMKKSILEKNICPDKECRLGLLAQAADDASDKAEKAQAELDLLVAEQSKKTMDGHFACRQARLFADYAKVRQERAARAFSNAVSKARKPDYDNVMCLFCHDQGKSSYLSRFGRFGSIEERVKTTFEEMMAVYGDLNNEDAIDAEEDIESIKTAMSDDDFLQFVELVNHLDALLEASKIRSDEHVELVKHLDAVKRARRRERGEL